MEKWQIEIAEDVKEMDNKTLLDEVLFLAQGDDYDGEFTKEGEWQYDYLVMELENRLKDWLTK